MSDTRTNSKINPFWIQEHYPDLLANSCRLVLWSRLLRPQSAPINTEHGYNFVVLYTTMAAAAALQPLGILTTTPAELPPLGDVDALSTRNLDRLVSTWSRWASEAADVIEHTPVPEAEWQPVLDALEVDDLAALLSVSAASLRRYHSGERATPQAVAERLHLVALIVADLAGSYNAYGIRRWFSRPRKLLEGRSPAEVLVGDWTPDDPDVRAVRSLASALVMLGAT